LLVKLHLFNLLLFFLFRLVFYWYNHAASSAPVPRIDTLMAFRMGVEFDSAVLCWIAFLPVLVFSIAYLLRDHFVFIYKAGFAVFVILLLIYYFVYTADIPYYRQFGSHLNHSALLWNESPDFVAGLVFGSFSYWGFLLVFLVMTAIALFMFRRFFRSFLQELPENRPHRFVWTIVYCLLLSGLVTLGARGRSSQRSGLHEGLSIVSGDVFTNVVAINPNFTFWKSVLYNKHEAYKVPADIDRDIAFTRSYLGIRSPFEKSINRVVQPDSAPRKLNVIVVVMESMSVYKMGYYKGKQLTPHLAQLARESAFFDHFFSSGIHTYNGLFSTTSGYPGILAEKSLKSYVKAPFDGIGMLLKKQGYETWFYTTHDPHFDNMNGFFTMNGFGHFVSQYEFNFTQAESSLGVPDHLLLDKMLEKISRRDTSKPFLSVLMTASDHGPWRIPKDIPFKPNSGNERDDCTLYADWSIGRFMETAKKQSWYKNTVFIFVGDHGLAMGHTYEMPLSYNHVPCIIHHPLLLKPDTISSPYYQPDITATVMGLLRLPYTNSTFGVDMFKDKHPFVMFSADDKIGCIDDKGNYYYKTLSNGQRYLRRYETLDPENYIDKQRSLADSLDRGVQAVFETARYFIREKNYLYE
jgi:phosphoglycerol transferase MdoB-like AlkP superfamily enzyme